MAKTPLMLLFLSLFFSTISSQSCKSHTFTSNQQFASCVDLPVLNSFLHWTYTPANNTARIAFRVTGVTSSTWVSWALNPTGSGMDGSQALVAYPASNSGITVHTSAVTGAGITATATSISFAVPSLTAMMSGGEIVIFATIVPPTTKVTQVWQVGPLTTKGAPGQHLLSGGNMKSSGSIDFTSGQTASSGSAASSRLRKKNTHGVLNAVSWGILMPLGAIIARYMRVFKSADPAWFYLHITCQLSAYIVGIAGWGTGLKLGSESKGITYHSHRNIGITLFCLATLQVFALLLRPKKDHKYRLYWNIYHHSIGYTVIILSVINVFKGLDILDTENKWQKAYIGVLIAMAAVVVVLEAFTWMVVLKRKREDSDKHGQSTNGHNNGYGHRTQPVV